MSWQAWVLLVYGVLEVISVAVAKDGMKVTNTTLNRVLAAVVGLVFIGVAVTL